MGRVVAFGEVLMRLTPPDHRHISQTDCLNVHFGGAEANVMVNLSNLGHDVRLLTSLPGHSVGDAAMIHLQAHRVDTSFIQRIDGRLGIYYYESGYSLRQAKVIYDRHSSSIQLLDEEMINWDLLLENVQLFHLTGITLALGPVVRQIALRALEEAKKRNISVSFDFNYRSALWSIEEAKIEFQKVLPYVSICFAGYKDFRASLDMEGPEEFDEEELKGFFKLATDRYGMRAIACTNRVVHQSNDHQLQGFLYMDGVTVQTKSFRFAIVDRIGGGDAFASGILHGLLIKKTAEETVQFGTGLAILKHFVSGDVSTYTGHDVERFINSPGVDVLR